MRDTKKTKWKNGLQIPEEGNRCVRFYCKECGHFIAQGYTRVVIGDRGPYIEFNDDQICSDSIEIVPNFHVYFEEFSSKCEHRIFVYHQAQTVSYADYLPDYWYIDPCLLRTDFVDCCYDTNEEETMKDLW